MPDVGNNRGMIEMQYDKLEVLTPSQKRLRKAAFLVPGTLVVGGAIVSKVLLGIGIERVPFGVLMAAVALVLIGVLASFITLCVMAYWLREHRRWLYGLYEVIFAIGLVVIASYNSIGSAPGTPPGWSFPLLSTLAQYAAGLYVMVRGFDNIGQGVKDDPVWGRRWRWFSLHQIDQPKKQADDDE
ncbi:hypothetical protein [Mesorhizobium caraganae]|uniref:hypothetical protein n=1 Tax=Mesorhizobium caraganae TaxID=483206 RepID=UPI00333CF15C